LEEYVFTGGVQLSKEGEFFTDNESQKFIKEPSPEVDREWHMLLSGMSQLAL
jgi:hypothetical protein